MLQQKVENIECLKFQQFPLIESFIIFQPLRIAYLFFNLDHLSRLLCSYMAKAKNLRQAWEPAGLLGDNDWGPVMFEWDSGRSYF